MSTINGVELRHNEKKNYPSFFPQKHVVQWMLEC